MRLLLKIVIVLACVIEAFLAGVSGLVMIFSPETARSGFGENDPSVGAGVLALVMAGLLIFTAYATFHSPESALIALAILIALEFQYIFVLNVGGPQLIGFTLVILGLALLSWRWSRGDDVDHHEADPDYPSRPQHAGSASRNRHCTQCGEPASTDSRFCGSCGASLA